MHIKHIWRERKMSRVVFILRIVVHFWLQSHTLNKTDWQKSDLKWINKKRAPEKKKCETAQNHFPFNGRTMPRFIFARDTFFRGIFWWFALESSNVFFLCILLLLSLAESMLFQSKLLLSFFCFFLMLAFSPIGRNFCEFGNHACAGRLINEISGFFLFMQKKIYEQMKHWISRCFLWARYFRRLVFDDSHTFYQHTNHTHNFNLVEWTWSKA